MHIAYTAAQERLGEELRAYFAGLSAPGSGAEPGYSRCRSSACLQCVIAGRPSSRGIQAIVTATESKSPQEQR